MVITPILFKPFFFFVYATILFWDNQMIAVCQNVAWSKEDKGGQLQKNKILMKGFTNQVLKPFLEDSMYENWSPFL